jgi:F0F1-type ATP synthase alpha subunit
MILTDKNQVEISKEVVETVDLIQLDTEMAHLKDIINQTQKVIDEKQALRYNITVEFPTIEEAVYPTPVEVSVETPIEVIK